MVLFVYLSRGGAYNPLAALSYAMSFLSKDSRNVCEGVIVLNL
jgi:hypothetical protein